MNERGEGGDKVYCGLRDRLMKLQGGRCWPISVRMRRLAHRVAGWGNPLLPPLLRVTDLHLLVAIAPPDLVYLSSCRTNGGSKRLGQTAVAYCYRFTKPAFISPSRSAFCTLHTKLPKIPTIYNFLRVGGSYWVVGAQASPDLDRRTWPDDTYRNLVKHDRTRMHTGRQTNRRTRRGKEI